MKLTKHVYLVGSGLQGIHLTDAYDCHVYLIDGGDELALIDTGAGMGVEQILQNIKDEGFHLDKLKYLLLTHGHADHSGGTKKLVEKTGIQVISSQLTAQYLENGDEESISLSFAKNAGFYPIDYVYEATPVDRIVKEGDIVTVGNLQLEVIETPGHSNDHLSYIMKTPESTYLFGGDLVFYEGKVATQFIPDCSVFDIGKSLIKLKDANIDCLLPGHDVFILKQGQSHINRAIDSIERLVIPSSIIY
ncbi:MBL fold metallo-hydrolase [Ferdinandcohnia sp. SAFN-114]|uniref:MBL fold metallo-hydrolase n=1 Tax=Ferdinandcohnia sp. SAFN-114 TaxID=3387275 RepID=UPI003F801EDA